MKSRHDILAEIFAHTDKKVQQNTQKIVNLYNKKAGRGMDPDVNDDLK
jgi:hypothetical protein